MHWIKFQAGTNGIFCEQEDFSDLPPNQRRKKLQSKIEEISWAYYDVSFCPGDFAYGLGLAQACLNKATSLRNFCFHLLLLMKFLNISCTVTSLSQAYCLILTSMALLSSLKDLGLE